MPQPTIPTTMRSDGAGWSSLPRALAGMMVGAATAAAVAAINRRREILGADGEVFIAKNFGRSAFRARVENPSMPGAGAHLGSTTVSGLAVRWNVGLGSPTNSQPGRQRWVVQASGMPGLACASMTVW